MTFTGESASGWQSQALDLDHLPARCHLRHLRQRELVLRLDGGGLATQVVSGPFRTVADGLNGVFATAAGTFPTQSYNTSNYFVDLVGSPAASAPPPTVTATTPASGANGVLTTSAVTATFSRSMDATSINSSTVTLTGPSGRFPPPSPSTARPMS